MGKNYTRIGFVICSLYSHQIFRWKEAYETVDRHVARKDGKQTQVFGGKNSRDKNTNAQFGKIILKLFLMTV